MAIPMSEEDFAHRVATYPPVLKWRSSSTKQEQRSVLLIHSEDIPNNLTASTLSVANGLPLSPFVFVDNEAGSLNAFYYLGAGLAGHSGVMHGGLLAVLLDECMGRACFPVVENRVAMTAALSISFRAPMHVPGIIYVEATTEKVEGKKASVKATVNKFGTPEVLIATATALFIEPKRAQSMKKLM
jgi:acyl-coenzyme A thioesterase PaaI-like protein